MGKLLFGRGRIIKSPVLLATLTHVCVLIACAPEVKHEFVGPPAPDYANEIAEVIENDGFDAPQVGDPNNEALHKVYEYILQLRCEAGR